MLYYVFSVRQIWSDSKKQSEGARRPRIFFNEVSLQRENLIASILPQTLDIKDSLKDEQNSRDNI